MKTETVINGFAVEVEDELTERVQCWITKGRASASLAALQDTGCLTGDDFDDVPVDGNTIDKITEWAEKNGY